MYNDGLNAEMVSKFLRLLQSSAENNENINNKTLYDALSNAEGRNIDYLWVHLSDFAEIVENLTEQTARMRRVLKERANADRKITPKKSSSGYVMIRYDVRKRVYAEGRTRDINNVVLQTPYDGRLTYNDIVEFTNKDILEISKILNCEISEIYIKEYNLNLRSGFWEIKTVQYNNTYDVDITLQNSSD